MPADKDEEPEVHSADVMVGTEWEVYVEPDGYWAGTTSLEEARNYARQDPTAKILRVVRTLEEP